jgi:SAM-dependent methyltransferase
LPVSAEPLRLAFGRAAFDYEHGRPGWPDEVALVGGLPASAEVLDLGAGTGKLTRALVRRFARVTAVEPDESMRALLGRVPGCSSVLAGSAEDVPVEDGSIDGVFCGDAFHWFDWPAAIAEIERVLRPGGVLVLGFHGPSGETEPPWPQAAWDVVSRYRRSGLEPGGSIIESGEWRKVFAGSRFEELRREEIPHEVVLDRDREVACTISVSIFAALPTEERARFGEELREALPDAVFRTPFLAEVWWSRLRAG